ncbi:hypothetical protein B0H13DRAFT_2207019 [Mycena leptocephala]|nr:hypothetical protein B0H13DRAFT_2207019 [Mycena leptocephala]
MPGSIIHCAHPAAKASHTEVKARRLAKKHTKERTTRLIDREQRRINAGTRLKGVAQLHIRQATPIWIQLSLEGMGSPGGPVASSSWQAIRQDEPDARSYALEELRALHPDFWVYDWQGIPTPVIDADRHILLCLGGFPDTPGWDAEVVCEAAGLMKVAAIEVYTELKWRCKAGLGEPTPRRGPHTAKSVGVSMGGGQTYPQNLAHSMRNLAIFARLFGEKSIQRIAGWTNMLFMAFAPDLHEFYHHNLDDLCTWDSVQDRAKHIVRNFANRLSVFATATFNFGPATVTLPHLDFRNLAWGWCTITALGDFDPNLGGHLVLWDLRMIIRFLPGSTILLPSAILRHSNTRICAHEMCFSFTQFTPAGLFRWVYNGYRTDKDIAKSASTSKEQHGQRRQDRAERWAEGMKMYCKWDGRIAAE